MTEIPEHLLQRSRERREALGLATPGGGGGSAPAGAEAAATTPAASAPQPQAATPAAAVEGAPVEAAAPPVPEEETPTYIAKQRLTKGRIPIWAIPALAALPFWALLYTGTFGERASHDEGPVDPIELGKEIYAANCAACHGATGGGGVGPALADGETVKTFPNVEDHIEWVRVGSGPFRGQPYGDPNREGGQRGPATGGMPGFPTLSQAELEAVVQYEREGF